MSGDCVLLFILYSIVQQFATFSSACYALFRNRTSIAKYEASFFYIEIIVKSSPPCFIFFLFYSFITSSPYNENLLIALIITYVDSKNQFVDKNQTISLNRKLLFYLFIFQMKQ